MKPLTSGQKLGKTFFNDLIKANQVSAQQGVDGFGGVVHSLQPYTILYVQAVETFTTEKDSTNKDKWTKGKCVEVRYVQDTGTNYKFDVPDSLKSNSDAKFDVYDPTKTVRQTDDRFFIFTHPLTGRWEVLTSPTDAKKTTFYVWLFGNPSYWTLTFDLTLDIWNTDTEEFNTVTKSVSFADDDTDTIVEIIVAAFDGYDIESDLLILHNHFGGTEVAITTSNPSSLKINGINNVVLSDFQGGLFAHVYIRSCYG